MIDSYLLLAAMRFVMWTGLGLVAAVNGAYLWQRCRGQFWRGTRFDEALFGWTVEALFLMLHQAFWWAKDHYRYAGHCRQRDDDPRIEALCRQSNWLESSDHFVMPFLYFGIFVGMYFVLSTMAVSVANISITAARWGVIGIGVCLLVAGLVITGLSA
jgi:uncharacterized membrane protein (DUF485 family)